MSFPGDRANEDVSLHALNSQAVTASANTTGVNATNTSQDVLLHVNVGAVTGTSPTLALQVQSSLNDNTATTKEAADPYSSISGALISLTAASAGTTQVLSFQTRGEAFLRLAMTAGGTSPSFQVAANFISSKLRL